MQNGDTPLARSSYNGHHETVEVLLTHGANVNAKVKVSRGGAPMGARMDWASAVGVRAMLQSDCCDKMRYTLVCDLQPVKQDDNSMALAIHTYSRYSEKPCTHLPTPPHTHPSRHTHTYILLSFTLLFLPLQSCNGDHAQNHSH